MSDETVQQLEAVIRRDGKGEVRDTDAVTPIEAPDSDELRALVMQHVIGVASELEGAVRLRIVDIDGVYHLLVHETGKIIEEGAVEPLQPGDDDLWSESAEGGEGGVDRSEADGAPGDDDLGGDDELGDDELDDDDGGFHDEILDDEFAEDVLADDVLADDDLDDDEPDDDEPDDDEPDDDERDDALDDDARDDDESADALDDDEAGATTTGGERHDGGYAALFGVHDAADDDDVDAQAHVHETIQLPRPGMMRDEPPAVTAMHPIVPPGGVAPSLPGSGAGSELAAESIEDHDHDHEHGASISGEPHEHEHRDGGEPHEHEHDDHAHEHHDHGGESHVHDWGENRFTAMHQHRGDAPGGVFGATDTAFDGESDGGFDLLASDPAFDDEAADDDSVIADWGTGGLDVVASGVAAVPDGVGKPQPEPAAPEAGPGAGAWIAPQRPASQGQAQPEWSPTFPRGDRSEATGAPARPTFDWSAPPSTSRDETPDASGEHDAAHEHPTPPDHPAAPRWARDRVPGAPSTSTQPGASAAPAQAGPTEQARQPEPAQTGGPDVGPTLGDFLADRTTRRELPASRGWRAGLRRTTGGLVNLGPGARERTEREELAAIQRQFDGPKTIVVVNPKGGAHKTTTTLMVAAAFGMHRGGYTIAWDNNETRGTLGWRSHRAAHNRTAVDLLRQLSHFEISGGATIADVDRFVRNQGEAKFDVLASDDDAASAAIIDAEAFWRLHRTLSRFYRVLVIDTGNNMRASNWEAALDVADQLVIVSTAREDTAASAAWLADGLRERGHGDKLANAVTVLSSPSAKEDPQLTARLRDHFAQLTRAVVEVPYDEEFVGGGELDIERLRAETRDAWRHAAAVIAQGL